MAHDQFKRALKSMGVNLTDNEIKTLFNGEKTEDVENNDDYDKPTRQKVQELVIEDFVKQVMQVARQKSTIQKEFVVPKPKSAIILNDKANQKDRDYEMMELKVQALK